MGQYHIPVNLDKKEYILPHKLGSGLKLWEQLANHPSTSGALIVLLAASNGRGGGDFDETENWHGPERQFPQHNASPGPMPENYEEVASAMIGRWAGDRIAIIGDYAERGDLPDEFEAETIYDRCGDGGDYVDISDWVARVLEHELHIQFVGDGWKDVVWLDKA